MLPRLTLILILSATLGACTVVPHAAWTFDPTKPQAKPVADPAFAAALSDRVATLQLELNDVRSKIAVQDDTFKRLPLYAQEHGIHQRLAPLQRELAQYASAR